MPDDTTTKVRALPKARIVGEPINAHVVQFVPEPRVDFERMRKLISGEAPASSKGTRDGSESGRTD